jgi:RNA polymerase sigma factor (sigma-70 family)
MSYLSAHVGRLPATRQKNIIVGKPSPQDDNRERFSKLVQPHLSEAYALAYRITGSHADAEDVLQEACLRAFRAVGDVVDSSARAWVMTIMRNSAFTWIRKNRPAAVFAVDDLEEVEVAQTDPGDPGPEMMLIAKSDMETGIAALPDQFRETVILRNLHGLSYREIAERTRVPVGTVMSRLARARSRFLTVAEKEEAGRNCGRQADALEERAPLSRAKGVRPQSSAKSARAALQEA